MSTPRRSPYRKSGTFFITCKTAQGRFLLQSDRMAGLLIDTMLEQRQKGIYQLHEFVVMPNHLHAVLTAADISHAVQQLKGRFAHDAIKTFGAANIWPRGFSDHQIRDDEDYSRHQNYIWMNPVKAGLVKDAKEFPYSSASARFELDPKPAAKAAGAEE